MRVELGFNAVIDVDGVPGGDQITLIGINYHYLGGSILV